MFDDSKKLDMVLAQRDEALALIKQIGDALGTSEEGAALVEVARNAHRAEMELASHFNDEDFD